MWSRILAEHETALRHKTGGHRSPQNVADIAARRAGLVDLVAMLKRDGAEAHKADERVRVAVVNMLCSDKIDAATARVFLA